MYLRRLNDLTKTSPLLRCFWEVFEMSLSIKVWYLIAQRYLMPVGNKGFNIMYFEQNRTQIYIYKNGEMIKIISNN